MHDKTSELSQEFPFALTPVTFDETCMALALQAAWRGFLLGEVPVGAVIAIGGEVIAEAHNSVERLQRASAHAEVKALHAASTKIGNWRLVGATLYSTLEPCSMCAGAALLSRVDKIVWGARDLRHGAGGSWVDLLNRPHPIHKLQIEEGLYASHSAELLQRFFRERRQRPRSPTKPPLSRSAQLIALLTSMAEQQRLELLRTAQALIPTVTGDDLWQPNDFPLLENDPFFRYEEGIWCGLLSALTAVKASFNESEEV